MGLDFAFLGVVVVGVARFRFLGFSAVADDDLVSSGGAAAAAAADVMVESGSSFDKVRKRSGFSIWTPPRADTVGGRAFMECELAQSPNCANNEKIFS